MDPDDRQNQRPRASSTPPDDMSSGMLERERAPLPELHWEQYLEQQRQQQQQQQQQHQQESQQQKHQRQREPRRKKGPRQQHQQLQAGKDDTSGVGAHETDDTKTGASSTAGIKRSSGPPGSLRVTRTEGSKKGKMSAWESGSFSTGRSTPHSDTRATSMADEGDDGPAKMAKLDEKPDEKSDEKPDEKLDEKPGEKPNKNDYPPLQSIPDNSNTLYPGPWAAGGVRFAPLRVPFRRRVQTAAVFWHCITFGTCIATFALLCSMPLLWPIIIIYVMHVLRSTWGRDGLCRLRSETFKSLPLWRWFVNYFPMRLYKTHDLPPTRKYIFGYHPHGIIAQGAWAAFGTNALGFSRLFPGITNSLLTLDTNFNVPLYREYLLTGGMASVSRESITNLLTRGGLDNQGMGRAVTIVVGGARESLQARPGTMRLIINERKGFIKLAMKLGADLVPVLSFGENDLYEQLDPETYPRVAAFQKMLLKWLKFTIPMVLGRGVLNYDVGLMPHRRPIAIVVGKPIEVAGPVGEPEVAEIDRLHGQYVAELQRIWDTYKDQFLPQRQTELEIVG